MHIFEHCVPDSAIHTCCWIRGANQESIADSRRTCRRSTVILGASDGTEVLRTTVLRSRDGSYLICTHCSWLREGDYAALDLTCLLASPLTIECLKRQSVTFVTFSILQQVGHVHMTNPELGKV